MNDDLLLIDGATIERLLEGRELELVAVARAAYQLHASGRTSLPHSVFLTFPDAPADRIIGLPAYLGGSFDAAGIKWISSFPDNLERGLERASALVILNSMETGRPQAVLEGSTISAKRTATSAALAAATLHGRPATGLGLVGCGRINFEIVRFLLALQTVAETAPMLAYDLEPERALNFANRWNQVAGKDRVQPAGSLEEVLARSELVSFATTAKVPYVASLAALPDGATVLHVSLRDLAVEAILAADNVVDDVDHVNRAATSIHLTAQAAGGTTFVRTTLGEVLNGSSGPRARPGSVTVFSPFGLGILDIAFAAYVVERAAELSAAVRLEHFWPTPWNAHGPPWAAPDRRQTPS